MAEDHSRLPADRRSLVAVYEDQAAANAAASAVRGVAGDELDVLFAEDARPVDSLIAEMQQEANETFLAAPVVVSYPKEARRTTGLLGPPLIAIFTLLFLPLGFVPIGEVDLWIRLLGAAVAGAVCGAAITAVVGPAMGVKRPTEPLAAERGVTVRLDSWSPDIEEVLVRDGLLRLDVVDRMGHESGWTVATQDTSKGDEVVNELVRNAHPADDDSRAASSPAPDRTIHRQR